MACNVDRAFVYLVGNRSYGWYKIGYSTNPEKRIKTLRHNVPFPIEKIHVLEVDHAPVVENALHSIFQDYRLPPGEWFSLEQEQVDSFPELAYEEEKRRANRRSASPSEKWWKRYLASHPAVATRIDAALDKKPQLSLFA